MAPPSENILGRMVLFSNEVGYTIKTITVCRKFSADDVHALRRLLFVNTYVYYGWCAPVSTHVCESFALFMRLKSIWARFFLPFSLSLSLFHFLILPITSCLCIVSLSISLSPLSQSLFLFWFSMCTLCCAPLVFVRMFHANCDCVEKYVWEYISRRATHNWKCVLYRVY